MVAGTKLSQIASGGSYAPATDALVGVRTVAGVPSDYLITLPGSIVGQPVVGASPNEFLYTDPSGNLQQDGGATRDNSDTNYKTSIAGFTNAVAVDSANSALFKAVTAGTGGNAISLVFNGTATISTIANAWNTANPTNQVNFSGASGSTVLSAQTITLAGGGETGLLVNTNTLTGQTGTGSLLALIDPTNNIVLANGAVLDPLNVAQYTTVNGITNNSTGLSANWLAQGDTTGTLQLYGLLTGTGGDMIGYIANQTGGSAVFYNNSWVDVTANNINAKVYNGAFVVDNYPSGDTVLSADTSTLIAEMGDIGGVTSLGNSLFINPSTGFNTITGPQTNIINKVGQVVARFDAANRYAALGDPDDIINHTRLLVDDNAQLINAQTNAQFRVADSASDIWITADMANHFVFIGDGNGNFNNNYSIVDDVAQNITNSVGNQFIIQDHLSNAPFLRIDFGAKDFIAGDIAGSGNDTNFEVNDNAQYIFNQVNGEFIVSDVPGNYFLYVNTTSRLVQSGDVQNSFNSTVWNVDDIAESMTATLHGSFHIRDTSTLADALLVNPSILRLLAGDVNNIQNSTLFGVDDSNNICYANSQYFQIRGVNYKFPTSQGANNTTLVNDGSGGLNWSSPFAVVVLSNDLTGQTAAVSSIATYTPSANGTFRIGGYLTVTAISLNVLNLQVTYTDETSTARTVSFSVMGTVSPSINAVGLYTFPDIQIRAKSGSAITVKTTSTGAGSQTYDVGATIEKLR